jgi:multidrug transporter EmrE-like cation transporter
MVGVVNTVSLAAFAIILAAGQLLFKKVGLAMRGRPFGDGLVAVAHEPALYAALTLYAGGTLLWIWLLSRIPLSRAYPWVAVALAIVSVASWYLFGERLGPMLLLGIALIGAGVVVIATAS